MYLSSLRGVASLSLLSLFLSLLSLSSLSLSVTAAETFVRTKVMEGLGDTTRLVHEAELVDDVEKHLQEHRFREAIHSSRTYLGMNTYVAAQLVDSLGSQEEYVSVPLTAASDTSSDFSLMSAPPGYVPTASEWDNPLTDTTATPILPSAPDCTVRPNTVLEVQKLRASSLELNKSIGKEVEAMHKRKAYVEEMTQYVNDRIRDLNKVKSELATEIRWVETSSNKISELSKQEQLIKYEDVLACLDKESKGATGAAIQKNQIIAKLKQKSTLISGEITKLQLKMSNTKKGVPDGAMQPLV